MDIIKNIIEKQYQFHEEYKLSLVRYPNLPIVTDALQMITQVESAYTVQ